MSARITGGPPIPEDHGALQPPLPSRSQQTDAILQKFSNQKMQEKLTVDRNPDVTTSFDRAKITIQTFLKGIRAKFSFITLFFKSLGKNSTENHGETARPAWQLDQSKSIQKNLTALHKVLEPKSANASASENQDRTINKLALYQSFLNEVKKSNPNDTATIQDLETKMAEIRQNIRNHLPLVMNEYNPSSIEKQISEIEKKIQVYQKENEEVITTSELKTLTNYQQLIKSSLIANNDEIIADLRSQISKLRETIE